MTAPKLTEINLQLQAYAMGLGFAFAEDVAVETQKGPKYPLARNATFCFVHSESLTVRQGSKEVIELSVS